jgi:hypothetical protein
MVEGIVIGFSDMLSIAQTVGIVGTITSLRTAVDNDGRLDKESTSYNDVFDAFRLALKFYHFEGSTD